ncbi:MAG TPA: hypothetical protein VEK34_07055 [Methylocella sp.]|nr:hypothetical protein [Methylocella sp.]
MFVTAFNGARDYYSLPQALHEAQLLERHITDLFYPNILVSLLSEIKRYNPALEIRRQNPTLPFSKVYIDLRALQQNVRIRLDNKTLQAIDRLVKVDKALSLRAAIIAKRTGTDLFLHSNYAYWAFKELPYARKYMFQFHPIVSGVSTLSKNDFELHPEVEWSFRHEIDSLPDEHLAVERRDE